MSNLLRYSARALSAEFAHASEKITTRVQGIHHPLYFGPPCTMTRIRFCPNMRLTCEIKLISNLWTTTNVHKLLWHCFELLPSDIRHVS